MEKINAVDVITAGRELPTTKRPELKRYLREHLERLTRVNPNLAALIELMIERTARIHHEASERTPEELGEYVGSLILLLVRTIEIAETRVTETGADDVRPMDIDLATILGRLARP